MVFVGIGTVRMSLCDLEMSLQMKCETRTKAVQVMRWYLRGPRSFRTAAIIMRTKSARLPVLRTRTAYHS